MKWSGEPFKAFCQTFAAARADRWTSSGGGKTKDYRILSYFFSPIAQLFLVATTVPESFLPFAKIGVGLQDVAKDRRQKLPITQHTRFPKISHPWQYDVP